MQLDQNLGVSRKFPEFKQFVMKTDEGVFFKLKIIASTFAPLHHRPNDHQKD